MPAKRAKKVKRAKKAVKKAAKKAAKKPMDTFLGYTIENCAIT